jgi:hypothetical protein
VADPTFTRGEIVAPTEEEAARGAFVIATRAGARLAVVTDGNTVVVPVHEQVELGEVALVLGAVEDGAVGAIAVGLGASATRQAIQAALEERASDGALLGSVVALFEADVDDD